MSNLFLDFETKDRAMEKGLGAGWCYENMLAVIGFAYAIDNEPSQWSTDINLLKSLVDHCTEITCHNAQYDVGVLNMLGIDYSNKKINCTVLLSKLFYNGFHSYSLQYLGNKWLGEGKLNDELAEFAKVLGLVKSKAQDAGKIAKVNMDTIYAAMPHIVEKYAKQDVDLTRKLYDKVKVEDKPWLSDLIKCVIDVRKRGVLVSLENLYKSKAQIEERIAESKLRMDVYLQGSNPNSSKQLGEVCQRLGIVAPTTDKGNPSFNKKACEQLDHPLFTELESYKTLQKLKSSFIDSTLENLTHIYNCSLEDLDKLKETRVHPELHIFGAVKTGRFSSSNPNIQQIPKHNELGKQLVRSLFIPEADHKWYCLDFSSQEPRMQVHFSAKIGSESGQLMALEWKNNPDFDMHQYVANMMGVDRKTAKAINLGLSYGMGSLKLSNALGLPLEYKVEVFEKTIFYYLEPVEKYFTRYPEKRPNKFPSNKTFNSFKEAKEYKAYVESIEGLEAVIDIFPNKESIAIKNLYHEKAPYLRELTDAAKHQILKNGYIKTFLNRKLYKDPDMVISGKRQDWSYKAINKLIQGSSADQTIAAMVKAYRSGIKIGYPIHDEITISTNKESDVWDLKDIMENVIILEVPSKTEVTVGDNFANQIKLEERSEEIHYKMS